MIDEPASFRDLRALIVGGRTGSVQILRTVLGMVGIVHIEAVSEPRRTVDLLRTEKFAAVFCDEHVEAVSGVPFTLAARRTQGVLDPMVPIFVLCSAAHRRQIELLRDMGVTDVLARPVSAATITRKLRTALAQPA